MKVTCIAALGNALMLAFPYALLMCCFPLLQHWLLYVLAGPATGIMFGWVYSMIPEGASSPPKYKSNILEGLVATLIHVGLVSAVWVSIKEGLITL